MSMKKTGQGLGFAMAALAACVAAAGCQYQRVKESGLAPRALLKDFQGLETFAIDGDNFPEGILRLSDHKWFLWREGVSGSHVSTVLQASRKIDSLEDDIYVLTATLRGLYQRMSAVDEKVRGVESRVEEIDAALGEKRPARDQLAEDCALGRPACDAGKLEGLKAEVEALETERAAQEAERGRLEEEKVPLQEQIDAEQERVAEPAEKLGEEAQAKLDELMAAVDYFRSPPAFMTFTLRGDGALDAEIKDWNLGDDAGVRTLKTETGGIRDVRYSPLGGRFSFQALIRDNPDATEGPVRETYCFRMSRARYDRREKGDDRKFFAVDILKVDGAAPTCDFDELKRLDRKQRLCADAERRAGGRSGLDADCKATLAAPRLNVRQGSGKSVDKRAL